MSINTKLYIEKYLRIQDKNSKIVPFKMNKPQMKLYNALKKQYEPEILKSEKEKLAANKKC